MTSWEESNILQNRANIKTISTASKPITAWSESPSNTKIPSEKLVKDTIDALEVRVAVLEAAVVETNGGEE